MTKNLRKLKFAWNVHMDQEYIFSPVPLFARDSFLDPIRKDAGFSRFCGEGTVGGYPREFGSVPNLPANWFGKTSGQHETHFCLHLMSRSEEATQTHHCYRKR